jgi:ADP-ribose pyrophosphatase YjhB (NUDIX family)
VAPVEHFAHCPRCGRPATPTAAGAPFRCSPCGFTLFFNAASAVAALVERADGRVLFIRRARNPGRGLLGLPGGFVDPGESAEQALRREVREEVGIEIERVTYLTSHANAYFYAEVTYTTLDLFYVARTADPDRAHPLDAVDGVEWLDPARVAPDAIAFESMRRAIAEYVALRPAAPDRR